jgi:hypothetical protein
LCCIEWPAPQCAARAVKIRFGPGWNCP